MRAQTFAKNFGKTLGTGRRVMFTFAVEVSGQLRSGHGGTAAVALVPAVHLKENQTRERVETEVTVQFSRIRTGQL